MESEQDGGVRKRGFLYLPEPKTFRLVDGDVIKAPRLELSERPLNSTKVEPWPGAPYEPKGDPLLAGVGPGSWVVRPDFTYKTAEGEDLVAPMRVATNLASRRKTRTRSASPSSAATA